MRPRRDAHGPRIADVVVDRLHVQIVVEHLHASVAAVADVDVAVRVHRHRVRQIQLPSLAAARAGLFDEAAVLVELHDARVAVAVGHEDVARCVPPDVGRPAEHVRFRRRRRRAWSRCDDAFDGFRPPAEHHHHAPFGVELDDHVRPLVDGPDVVVRVDADGVRELEAVQALADLANERAVLIELEQSRVAAARVDEHVPLRVGRDADALAEIQIRRQLEEVRHRVVRNLRNVLGLGLALGMERQGCEHDGQQKHQLTAAAH